MLKDLHAYTKILKLATTVLYTVGFIFNGHIQDDMKDHQCRLFKTQTQRQDQQQQGVIQRQERFAWRRFPRG
jgi:hypothetical protein